MEKDELNVGVKEDEGKIDESTIDIDSLETGDDVNEEADDEAIESLRQSIESANSPTPKKAETEDSPKPKKIEIQYENFFSGDADALDNLLHDPKGFNDLLNKIYKKGIEAGHTLSVESIMTSAPGIIKNQVMQNITINNAVKDFYKDNSDLLPYKNTVGKIVNKVVSDNPQLSLKEVFDKTAKLSRQVLKLKSKAETDDKGKGGGQFPKKPSGSRQTRTDDSAKTGAAKEIDDMLKALG